MLKHLKFCHVTGGKYRLSPLFKWYRYWELQKYRLQSQNFVWLREASGRSRSFNIRKEIIYDSTWERKSH